MRPDAAPFLDVRRAAIARIAQYAVERAPAAFKTIAAISLVGPFMAPAAAAAAGIAIMGFAGKVASAEGGYDIPRSLNPMARLHSNEMLLRAALADRVCNMTDAGSGGSVTFNVHYVNSKGVSSFWSRAKEHIVAVVKGAERDFSLRWDIES